MSIFNPFHKHTVTALALTVMITLPSLAQADKIDDLFAQLQAVPDDQGEQSARIVGQINAIWSDSGSASMDLLLKRGADALQDGDTQAAIEHYSALVDHAPDFAAGYNARAQAYLIAGYFGPALVDLHTALALNPRHFDAMKGIGIIQEEIGEPEQALESFRKALELNPSDKDLQMAIAHLAGVAL